jgi:hypothetical protein
MSQANWRAKDRSQTATEAFEEQRDRQVVGQADRSPQPDVFARKSIYGFGSMPDKMAPSSSTTHFDFA